MAYKGENMKNNRKTGGNGWKMVLSGLKMAKNGPNQPKLILSNPGF